MSKFIPNSFQVPNALVDDVLGNLSDAALRVYIIIIRKTRGWHKESDRISLSQFQAIGKRSRHTVIAGLSELESLGLVTKTDTEKGSVWALTDGQASANNAPVEDSAKSALVQNLHQPSAKSAPVASAESAHTKDTLTKDTNKTQESAPAKKPTRKAATTAMPENFGISEKVREWAIKGGHTNLEQHLESFIGKAQAKGYVYANWDAAFQNAVREDWAGLRNAQISSQPQNLPAYRPIRIVPSVSEPVSEESRLALMALMGESA